MNTANHDVDVLIVGAGAAGLTLAIELARRGVSFRMIEKLKEPFRGSRGKGIQPRTLEVFEDLGILDQVSAVGGYFPTIRAYQANGTFAALQMTEHVEPSPAVPYPMALLLPQFLTEAIMRKQLAALGHEPEFASELIGLHQDTDAGIARVRSLRGEESIRARYIAGADGGHSFVRGAAGMDFPGAALGARAVVADVFIDGLGRDVWHLFNAGSTSAQIGLCPLPGTDLFQMQAALSTDGEVDLSAAGLNAMILARTGRADIRIQSVSWGSAFRTSARLADRFRAGKIFLLGDAAHVHPPTGAQGLNTSIQDAYNLGWKLDAVILAGAPETLLDTYEEERRPVAAEMLGLSRRLLETAQRGEVRRGPEVQQLDIGYPSSTLTVTASSRLSVVKPGQRAPDATLRGADAQPVRLFDLLKGPHWTMLGYRAPGLPFAAHPNLHVYAIGERCELHDPHRHFEAAYELDRGTYLLIRPDGYVAGIFATSEVRALTQYLKRCGVFLESTDASQGRVNHVRSGNWR